MFSFNINDSNYKRVHFIGIGGISMSGLAEILLANGYTVSGSDSKESKIIAHLKNAGAAIYIGQSKNNINEPDLVVYTDAISIDNEELLEAKSRNIEIIDRASFLGALMKNFKNSIAVSGTHGKTTTTSMLATIINKTYLNPTILLGGELDDIGGNVKLGSNDYLLTEACEYKANILKYYPTLAIVLNIDEDHLDYFKSIDHIRDTFCTYISNLNETDTLIANIDDEQVEKIIPFSRAKVLSIGINNTKATFQAKNIEFKQGYPSYDLYFENELLRKIALNVMGLHNVYNSLAAIAAAYSLDLDIETIANKISLYGGVHRRLEYKGSIGEVRIIDDYAHHPTEIKASLNALRQSPREKIYCVFQPHTFTRTKILLDAFSEAFRDADKIIIADIYAAREVDNGDVHSKDLANRIKENGCDVIYLSSFKAIEEYLMENVKNHDLIVTMGAGSVYEIGENLLKM